MGRTGTARISTDRMVMQPAADGQVGGSATFVTRRYSVERDSNCRHASLPAVALPFNCGFFRLNISSPVHEAKPATEKKTETGCFCLPACLPTDCLTDYLPD